MRAQFTFYESFLDAINDLEDADQLAAYRAVATYALTGEIPNITGAASAVFKLIRPILDKAAQKAENSKSKSNEEQTENKPKSNAKQTRNRPKSNRKQTDHEGEREIEIELELEREYNNPPKSPQGDAFVLFSDGNKELLTALNDFASMRKKTNRPLTDRAKQMLLSKLKKLSSDPAEQAKILDQSTYHGWQDVYELKEVERESNRGVPSSGEIGLVL